MSPPDPRVPLPGSAGPATTPPGGGAAARYPLGPLIAAMGVSFNQACEQLRLSGASRNLYATDGMPEHVADRLAIEAGQFPYTVWPEMADHIIDTAANLPDFDWDKARHERRIQEGRMERQRARRSVERELAS